MKQKFEKKKCNVIFLNLICICFSTRKKKSFSKIKYRFSRFFLLYSILIFFFDRIDFRIFKIIVLITYVIWYSRIVSTTKSRTQFVEYYSFDEKNNNENEKIFRNNDTNEKSSTTKSINVKRIFVNNVTRKFDIVILNESYKIRIDKSKIFVFVVQLRFVTSLIIL